MRVDSLRPLMDGVPAHRAACGMVVSRVGACAFLSSSQTEPVDSIARFEASAGWVINRRVRNRKSARKAEGCVRSTLI
jgi:hypothetical protein